MGQEIKIRSKPDKSGNPSSEPWEFYEIGTILAEKSRNPKNPSQKIFHFLKDFHSLTPAGVPFPLEQSLILNKSHSQALCSQCLTARPRG